jgi:peroxiredoxin Q/BCP
LLGITFSSPEDLKTWKDETGLTTDLLCDADRSVAIAYGAAESADQDRPARISVLIGPDGKVAKVYPKPDPETHPTEALLDLG